MRENEKARCYSQAIDLLVEQAVDAKRPDNPGAYAATVRCDLSKRLRGRARELFAEHDDITADELATILAAEEKRPTLELVESPAAPALPAYRAEPWKPPPASARMLARKRLAEIREANGIPSKHQETQT